MVLVLRGGNPLLAPLNDLKNRSGAILKITLQLLLMDFRPDVLVWQKHEVPLSRC